MRIRNMSYSDYGFAPGEGERLVDYCGRPDFNEDYLLLECTKKSNEVIAGDLYYSLIRGLSWEQLDRRTMQLYNKTDFYAYRRKALGLFRAALIECGRYPVKV